MVDVLHGTNYVLRPIYDEVVAELGEPPLGYPDECKFAWPETTDEEIVALAAEIVQIKRKYLDAVKSAHAPRDEHGRFVKRTCE